MLKGLALTPPVVGRISIGKVVERNGKRLPEKDDEFTLTSQVQSRGAWVHHPLDEALRSGNTEAGGSSTKLRNIPVRLLFDDPALNLRANYTLFDRVSGRPLCVGDGETCKRAYVSKAQSLACEGPEFCDYAQGRCKPYGRMNVRVGDEDELGSFVFRTTGFNSIRTLATRLRYWHAASGGLLSTLPLELRLRGKSTTQSHRAPIYYVDLTLRSGMSLVEALAMARQEREARQDAGWDQAALDAVAREGFAAGAFEDSEEDGAAVVEEFYPEIEDGKDTSAATAAPTPASGAAGNARRSGLAAKLVARTEKVFPDLAEEDF